MEEKPLRRNSFLPQHLCPPLRHVRCADVRGFSGAVPEARRSV